MFTGISAQESFRCSTLENYLVKFSDKELNNTILAQKSVSLVGLVHGLGELYSSELRGSHISKHFLSKVSNYSMSKRLIASKLNLLTVTIL